MTTSDCRSLFSCQYPSYHPRFPPSVILVFFLLSSSPFPRLSSLTLVIEDPGSFLLSFCYCLSSPTLVPDLIGAPVKEWIQSSKGSSVFAVGPCSWSSYPRDPIAAPPHGACGRGCAPVPNSIWGRGLSERSACPEQREGTLKQQPTAWKSRFLPSTDSGQALCSE